MTGGQISVESSPARPVVAAPMAPAASHAHHPHHRGHHGGGYHKQQQQHHAPAGQSHHHHHQQQQQPTSASSSSVGGGGGLPPMKYQEMSPEVTLVEFISTSAAFHGVKRQNIKQLEWDILKVFPNNIMPANAAAWYMAKRRFYMGNAYEYQLLPFLLKNYPKKFAVKGSTVEFLETYTKEVARKKMHQMIRQGILAYFSHKVEEHGVYFFDPYYYETTEPFHANLRLVTNSHSAHRSKLLPTFFEQHQNHFYYQAHSPYLVTISKQPVEVKTNTVGIVVSMVDNQFGIIQFPSGTGTEKALFSAKSLFRDGWLYQGDPMKLPPMEFDGYRVPNLPAGSQSVGGGGSGSGGGGGSQKDVKADFTWYAVLVWCGRKPSPKYCATKEDLTSSPYFQNSVQNTPGLPSGTVLQPHPAVSFEELSHGTSATQNKAGGKNKKHHHQQHQNHSASQQQQQAGKGACMQVGEVLSIRKAGAVVSLGKDSDEKAFIPGWAHRNLKFKGSFLTTTQGVELAIGDLITFCVDPSHEEVKPFKFVGCNVTVLKHADDKNKHPLSATSSATLLPAGDASSSATTLPSKDNDPNLQQQQPGGKKGRKNRNKKISEASTNGNNRQNQQQDVTGQQKARAGGHRKKSEGAASDNDAGGNRKVKKGRKGDAGNSANAATKDKAVSTEAPKEAKKRNKKRSESGAAATDGTGAQRKPKRERGPKVPYYLRFLLAPSKSAVKAAEAAAAAAAANEDKEKEGGDQPPAETPSTAIAVVEGVDDRAVVEVPSSDSESEYDSDVDPSFVPPASHDPDLDYDEYSDGEVPEEEEKDLLDDAKVVFTEEMQADLRQKLKKFEENEKRKKEEEEEERKTKEEGAVEKASDPAAVATTTEEEEGEKAKTEEEEEKEADSDKKEDKSADDGDDASKKETETTEDKSEEKKGEESAAKEEGEKAEAEEGEQKS